MSKTDENLETAINGEARARLKYTAFALQAMQEGHAEIAQLFLEAAGAGSSRQRRSARDNKGRSPPAQRARREQAAV